MRDAMRRANNGYACLAGDRTCKWKKPLFFDPRRDMASIHKTGFRYTQAAIAQ
jgi:hypothetical protein